MNDQDKKLTPEEQKALEDKLNKIYSLELKQREWIVIYNILVSLQYKLGDARIVNMICDKLQPIVTVDSNIKEDKKEEKKESEKPPETGVLVN